MTQVPLNSLYIPRPNPIYCRKQQSLGLLCSSFLSLYDRDGVETIALDDASARLGVAKRRIYDIINVLGAIGLLTKKAKNHYSWRGFGVVMKALQVLKKEGPKDSYTSFDDDVFLKAVDDDKGDRLCSFDSSSQHEKPNGSSISKFSGSEPLKSDHRKEKCLGLLTQSFVKLFLCSDVEIISLEETQKKLLGDVHDQSPTRNNSAAKIRRLYDIANVLSSMNFIEKTYDPLTRKPAFRWTGMIGKPQMATSNGRVLDSKKRTFGTELTNTSIRRCIVAPSSNATTRTVALSQTQIECGTAKKVVIESDLKNGSTQNVQKFQFGPFAAIMPEDKRKGNIDGTQIRDWESLAITHRPQYQNLALRELFGHYMGAWNYFCSEVAGKNPV